MAQVRSGERVVLIMDGAPATGRVQQLAEAGYEVTPVSPYRWVTPDPEAAAALASSIATGAVDAVTFSTARAVEHLVASARQSAVFDDLARSTSSGAVALACTGSEAARRIVELGLGPATAPSSHGIGAMVRCLERRLAAPSPPAAAPTSALGRSPGRSEVTTLVGVG